MAGQWSGVCRTETDLKFWGDAYLVAVQIYVDSTVRDESLGRRLETACNTADRMLSHFQAARESMEDYQSRG